MSLLKSSFVLSYIQPKQRGYQAKTEHTTQASLSEQRPQSSQQPNTVKIIVEDKSAIKSEH